MFHSKRYTRYFLTEVEHLQFNRIINTFMIWSNHITIMIPGYRIRKTNHSQSYISIIWILQNRPNLGYDYYKFQVQPDVRIDAYDDLSN